MAFLFEYFTATMEVKMAFTGHLLYMPGSLTYFILLNPYSLYNNTDDEVGVQ